MSNKSLTLRFGKRDEIKYQKVIKWLETIPEGWVAISIKDALLEYIEVNNLLENIQNQPRQDKPLKNNISVKTNNAEKAAISYKKNSFIPEKEPTESDDSQTEVIADIDSFIGKFDN